MHNGFGQYAKALAAARQACEHEDVMSYGWALVELVEAAVRDGQRDEAVAALDGLIERTQASGTDWALGVEARSPCALARRRGLLQGVDRAARAQPRRGRARAEPARVRRVAAPPEPPHGRTRIPPRRA